MATNRDPESKHVHAARSLVVRDASDIEEVSALLGRGEQVVALFPSNMERETQDSLTSQLIETANAIGATVSAIQVGAIGDGPRRWRKWMQYLKWSCTLIMSPRDLTDPSVTVAWIPEAETGIERLVVSELKSFKYGVAEDEVRRQDQGPKEQG